MALSAVKVDGMTMNNAESALSSSGIQPMQQAILRRLQVSRPASFKTLAIREEYHTKGHYTTAPTPSTSTDMLDDQGGVDAGGSEMDSVVEAGEGVVAGRGDGEGYGTNSNSSPSKGRTHSNTLTRSTS